MRIILVVVFFVFSSHAAISQSLPPRIDISSQFIALTKANVLIADGNKLASKASAQRKSNVRGFFVWGTIAALGVVVAMQAENIDSKALASATEVTGGGIAIFFGIATIMTVFDSSPKWDRYSARKKFEEADKVYRSIK